jgi:AcrR family transcriptional regulator
MSNERRKYTMRRRAEKEQETRLRITEAAMKLHGTIGPAQTTISAVANEAGVQRATVYRHFPDEEALFAACSGHWAALNPLPDPTAWRAVREPDARLRRALEELYAYYRRTETMLVNVNRDRPLVPAMAKPAARMGAYYESVVEALVTGRPERGRARARVTAAIGHATGFPTWRSLVRERGLDDGEAVALMAAMVAAAGRVDRYPKSRSTA